MRYYQKGGCPGAILGSWAGTGRAMQWGHVPSWPRRRLGRFLQGSGKPHSWQPTAGSQGRLPEKLLKPHCWTSNYVTHFTPCTGSCAHEGGSKSVWLHNATEKCKPFAWLGGPAIQEVGTGQQWPGVTGCWLGHYFLSSEIHFCAAYLLAKEKFQL